MERLYLLTFYTFPLDYSYYISSILLQCISEESTIVLRALDRDGQDIRVGSKKFSSPFWATWVRSWDVNP